jgi:hypothetical protein
MQKLSIRQKIQLLIKGYAFLRYEKRKGWRDYLPIYIVKCNKHGLFEDYPHGYNGYFICPKCREEEKKNAVNC